MNYQSNSDYGNGYRPLPRPSSSGTLPGGSQYEPATKRQRMQEPPAAGSGYSPQPLPYHIPPSNVTFPYGMQPPPRPMPLPYVNNQWTPQPWYREPPKVDVGPKQQPQCMENKVVPEDDQEAESEEDENPQQREMSTEDQDSNASHTVPGTSITLATEEDILKWREERKKMWLLKISNNKQRHMQDMGIKEDELKGQKSVLQEAKKQKQFIQNIQNQVNRINPRSTLSVRIAQREMARENSNLLDFIERLGDANLLNCELTDFEKEKLFGSNDSIQKKGRNNTYKSNDSHGPNRAQHRR